MGKICKRCDTYKDTHEYNKSSRNTDGLQSYCKTCHLDYSHEYQIKNPGKGTDRHYKRVFGIGLEDVKQILQIQNNCCALCEKELTLLQGRGFATAVHVDHDHTTNKIRGVLCGNCNTALGKLGDSVESIEKVLSYLKGTLYV